MRKAIKFQEGDYVFLRVTSVTSVGCVLKSKKLVLHFIGLFQILQMRKYILDLTHVIQFDGVQVRENLTVETLPLRIEDREVKHLRGKEIASVKVVWGGPVGGSVTWELKSRMIESFPELFLSDLFN
ncbi:uncharacterized protein LOC127136810 [Lathyrus oleraceus]|uniref:uncharacterized protein LOC127136810 n=1 Tax=Pisum sativum TaxID=3888 RepID=UPI0021CF2207|nr:uncharacterized protein LOC127136810 [Pisum sativum]